MIDILFPIADTCISEYDANVNFGKADSLVVGNSLTRPDCYRVLLKFDVSSLHSDITISKILLRLYVYKKDKPGNQEVTAYKLIDNFQEMEADWNNQPSHANEGFNSIISDSSLNGYFDIDVTSIVKQWLNDESPAVHGIEIISSQNASPFIWFRSREYSTASMWPRLIVEYEDSKLTTDYRKDGEVEIENCSLYQEGQNCSTAYKIKNNGNKQTLAVLEISDDGFVWFSEKDILLIQGQYKVVSTSSPRKYDRISLIIIKEPQLFLPTESTFLAEDNIINKNSIGLNYGSNDINIPVDEAGQIVVNKTGTANISISPKSVVNSPNISFNVVGQVKDNDELSNALDDVSINNINIPAGNFSIFNHSIEISRNITISGMVNEQGNPITTLILSDMNIYIQSLNDIKVTFENINLIGLTSNTDGINFVGQFLINSSISLKNVHMRNFNTALNFERLANIDITECEFVNNNQGIVFNNTLNSRIFKTKLKDNSKAVVLSRGMNIDINAEFENSLSDDSIGISLYDTSENINISGSSFTGFDLHNRVKYTDIPDLPEYHVIYGVSTENDLRYVLVNWPEIGTINLLDDVLNISTPLEIERPVILSGISRKVRITAAANISNLSFTPYSAVVAANSNNVTIENLTIAGNGYAQNGIYVHGDNCSIYNNTIKNIVRPEGKAACGAGIIVYKEGTTASPSPINTLSVASNTITNTARHGIFVDAFNTETNQFFMSTNIAVTNNVVNNVWNDPLLPIETKEPNGMFSAAIELQGLQKSTTELKNNLISNVKYNLKETYIYFIDTDETLINGVLASHKADLSFIDIGINQVNLSEALITGTHPDGTILLINADTAVGINITQGEPHETVVVKVNNTVVDKTEWDSKIFNINDVILVQSTSQDTVLTNIYKITINKKALQHVNVSTEQELRNAIANDSVGYITLLNNITLASGLSINKYIVLDGDINHKYSLTTPNAGNDILLGNGSHGSVFNNLMILGELVIDIGKHGSVSLHNVDVPPSYLGIRVLSGDINSIHLYGVNTPRLRFYGNARVILDEDTTSGSSKKTIIPEIIVNSAPQSTRVPILQVIGSEVTNLNIESEDSSIIVEQGASINDLNINGTNTNVQINTNGKVKTVQINKENVNLVLDNGSAVENLNLNSNNLTIDGKNIAHINIQSGVTDISTIDVKGYEHTDNTAETSNSLAVVFALTQANITTIKLDGIFEGIPISGKSITSISGALDNKIVTVDDTKVLKFAIIVYSIMKVNLLSGIYDEALEINRPITLQGASGVILKQKTEKLATETAIIIGSSNVKINGLEIKDWNIGIENRQDKQSYTNLNISNNKIYMPENSSYGMYIGYDAEAFHYPSDDPRYLDDMIDFKGLIIQNNEVSGTGSHAVILQSVKASEGKLTINNNDIYNSKGYGIWIDTSKNINITNNNVHDNIIFGIYFSSIGEGTHSITGKVPSDIIMTKNELTNNISSNLAFDGADLTTIEIGGNSITNNILDGKLIENNLSTTANVPKNWWGTAYKPTIQSKIIGTANFIPYYVDASKTILSNVKTDVHVNPNYTDGNSGIYIYGYSAFSTIKESLEKIKDFN